MITANKFVVVVVAAVLLLLLLLLLLLDGAMRSNECYSIVFFSASIFVLFCMTKQERRSRGCKGCIYNPNIFSTPTFLPEIK